MVLKRNTTRTFHRRLYAGEMEKVKILKRNDDQQQGTVRALICYQARRSAIIKTGETYQGDMIGDHTTVWHIPFVEMQRLGINYFNPADRIVQLEGREKGNTWMPEATTVIDVKLFGNHIDLACKRCDPPKT